MRTETGFIEAQTDLSILPESPFTFTVDLESSLFFGASLPMALTEIDRGLLERCLAEKPGAWKDFVDRFIGLFVHVINHTAHARSVRLAPHDIDDLCAEIFLKLLENEAAVLRRFKGNCSLATYLTVVSRRIAVHEIHRRRVAETFGHVSAQSRAPVSGPKSTTSSELQRIQNQDEVQNMLHSLSKTDAEIVRQFHLEGRTYREISSKLGVPENSIGPTLSRARKQLRQNGSVGDLRG